MKRTLTLTIEITETEEGKEEVRQTLTTDGCFNPVEVVWYLQHFVTEFIINKGQ